MSNYCDTKLMRCEYVSLTCLKKKIKALEKHILHFSSRVDSWENVASDMQLWKSSLCDVTTGTTITEDAPSHTSSETTNNVPPSQKKKHVLGFAAVVSISYLCTVLQTAG